jgi:hypothetical protein
LQNTEEFLCEIGNDVNGWRVCSIEPSYVELEHEGQHQRIMIDR